MAQLLQPGSDEGDDEKQPLEAEHYQCVFRKAHDSIYMMLKNKKSKRSFTNTFSKSTLMEMNLTQSLDKTISMLETARSGSQSQVRFEIKFGKADNDKKVAADQLSATYEKGDALFVIVTVDYSFLYAQHCFKLLEQKRSETDILHDIIEDMQTEIEQLKVKVEKASTTATGIAAWKVSSQPTSDANIAMETEYVPCTLEGMVTLSDDKKTVHIGIAGIYRVCIELSYTAYNNGCSGDFLEIRVNGKTVAKRFAGRPSGYGNMTYLFRLQKGDQMVFYTNCISSHGINSETNWFSVERLQYD